MVRFCDGQFIKPIRAGSVGPSARPHYGLTWETPAAPYTVRDDSVVSFYLGHGESKVKGHYEGLLWSWRFDI